jgi:hypothetical protein
MRNRLGWCDWIDLAQDRDPQKVVVNMVMKLRVPETFQYFLSSWENGDVISMELAGPSLIIQFCICKFLVTNIH